MAPGNRSRSKSKGRREAPGPMPRARAKGTTLLEVMVAVAVIAIAMAAALGSQSQSVSFSSDAKFSITSALLARQKASEIELEDPENLIRSEGDFGGDFPGYGWKMDVTGAAPTRIEGAERHLKRVDLTITRGKGDRYAYAVRLYVFAPRAP
jgi:general secretion pathway protein I